MLTYNVTIVFFQKRGDCSPENSVVEQWGVNPSTDLYMMLFQHIAQIITDIVAIWTTASI